MELIEQPVLHLVHRQFMEWDKLPRYGPKQLEWLTCQYKRAGRTALGGVLGDWGRTAAEMAPLHEHGGLWLAEGALVGPYVSMSNSREQLPGLAFYVIYNSVENSGELAQVLHPDFPAKTNDDLKLATI